MKLQYKCPQCNEVLLIDDGIKQEIKCPKCTHHGVLATFQQVIKRERTCLSCNNKWNEFFPIGENIPNDYVCPNCGVKTRTDATQIVGGSNMFIPGVLELINDSDGKWVGPETTFILKRGVNTIGRKATEPKAQILLPTKDEYMSRCHIKIEVNPLATGIMEHYLVDNASINGVYLNGERLCPGQIVSLEVDDEIKLGHTSFIFRACTPFDLEKSK